MATYQQLCEIGESFAEFVGRGLPSEIAAVHEVQRKLAGEGAISADTLERLKRVSRRYHLLVAGEMWCPDCQLNMSAFAFMQRIQPLIELAIITKGRAEDDLKQRLGLDTIRVPVVAVLDAEFQLLGCFVERPQQVITGGKDVMPDYRAGRFLESSIGDLLQIIETAEKPAAG